MHQTPGSRTSNLRGSLTTTSSNMELGAGDAAGDAVGAWSWRCSWSWCCTGMRYSSERAYRYQELPCDTRKGKSLKPIPVNLLAVCGSTRCLSRVACASAHQPSGSWVTNCTTGSSRASRTPAHTAGRVTEPARIADSRAASVVRHDVLSLSVLRLHAK